MPISLNDIIQRLLQPIGARLSAHRLAAEQPEVLSLEDLRERHRIRLEQELAREKRKLDAMLVRPFNGLL